MPDEGDPIAEALAAVDAQFTAQETGVLDTAAAPDDPLYDDEEVVDAEAEAPDDVPLETEADEAAAPGDPTGVTPAALPWENPASPYYGQFLQFQQTEQRRQELEAQQTRTQLFLDALRTARETEDAKAFHQQLTDIDPQLAQQWLGQRTGMFQQVQNAEAQRVGTLNGAAAMHLAMVDVLGDEATVQQVIARSRELLATGGLPQMQQAVMQRKQFAQQKTQREAALEQQVKELQLKVAARGRKASGVDRVDATRAQAVRAKSAEETETFDDFWDQISPGLAEHFGWGS